MEYWSRWGGANNTDKVDVARMPAFDETHAPTKVVRTPFVGDHTAFLQKTTVAFAGGTGPDVFTVGTPGIPLFGKQGSLLSVETYPAVKKELADYFGPVQELGKYKGVLYGLNYFIDMGVTQYRKDLLEQEGLPSDRKSLPKTWEQFREWGRKLARWEGGTLSRIGFNMPTDDKLFLTAVNQLGKGLFNKDLTKANLDGPEAERSLQMLVDFVHRDRMDIRGDARPKAPSGLNIMGTGLCAINHGSPEGLASLRTNNLDPKALIVTDFTPEWTGKPTATGYLGGTWAMANKATRSPDEAVEVLLFLTTPEHNLAIGEATYTVVSRRSQDKSTVAQDPVLRPVLRGPGQGLEPAPDHRDRRHPQQRAHPDDRRHRPEEERQGGPGQYGPVRQHQAGHQWLAPRPPPLRDPGCCSSPARPGGSAPSTAATCTRAGRWGTPPASGACA